MKTKNLKNSTVKTTNKTKTKNTTKAVKKKVASTPSKSTAQKNDKQIRDRAYFIWLEKQMPELDCWLEAEKEFAIRK